MTRARTWKLVAAATPVWLAAAKSAGFVAIAKAMAHFDFAGAQVGKMVLITQATIVSKPPAPVN